MKLSKLIEKLQKEADHWKSRGWDDPIVWDICSDDLDRLEIQLVARAKYDTQIGCMTAFKPLRSIRVPVKCWERKS